MLAIQYYGRITKSKPRACSSFSNMVEYPQSNHHNLPIHLPGAELPAPHVDTSSDPEAFRIQVEAFREQGGAAWLTLLNQMQAARGEAQDQGPEVQEEPTSEVEEVVEDKVLM